MHHLNSNQLLALKGAESLLLILPQEVSAKLDVENQEWLTFEVRNKELVIKKITNGKRSLKANDMEVGEIGITLPCYSKDDPFNSVLYTPQVKDTA